ncbi:hypothetical protein As57867_006669, partial [Aphanomyces stellatus]
ASCQGCGHSPAVHGRAPATDSKARRRKARARDPINHAPGWLFVVSDGMADAVAPTNDVVANTGAGPRRSTTSAKVVPANILDPLSSFSISTCNLNGLRRNGHLVARRLKSPPTCVLFQETKMRNRKQLETFHRHLDNEVRGGAYTLYTNDHRATQDEPAHRRHCGVASFFHRSMPGYTTLTHLSQYDVPGRYLVARALWGNLPVYIHNVYAPVESDLRGAFFELLPRDFEPESLHLVGGDFNIPLHSTLDTCSPHPRHGGGKQDCVEWLTALGVVDAWRQLNPRTRLYSGPTRANRFDYLFLDHELVSQLNPKATYDKNDFGGDHLTHTVTLSRSPTPTTKPYWRLPRELLLDPNIRSAITMEATSLLASMRDGQDLNHGAMWYGWLKRMKAKLIHCHRLHT